MWRSSVPALDVRVWRDEFRVWRDERRARVATEELRGEAFVLNLADRIRRLGPGTIQPHRLYHEAVQAFKRGEITFDEVTPLYMHAMIHAGAIIPKDRDRFEYCPTCEVKLDRGTAAS